MKIATIAPMQYAKGELRYHCFIRGGVGADYHQGPSFFIYPNGDLLTYWGAYDFDECSQNSVLLHSVSKDHGINWSDPQIFMADYPGGVPSFVHLLRLQHSKETLMFFARSRHHIEVDEKTRVATKGSNYFQSSTRLFMRRSTDGGVTFDHGQPIDWKTVSGGKALPNVGFYGSIDQAVQLSSGRILVSFMFMDPTYVNDWSQPNQHYTVAYLYSDDLGKTWNRSEEITVDTLRGVMEIQMVETQEDRLFALFRTKGGYLYQTHSKDGGITWSKSTPSALTAPESMARLIKLKSGRLCTVWNNVSSTTQQPRHPLVAALSDDGGTTWSAPMVIAQEVGTNQLSNHGMIQLSDGRILLGISHYRDVRPMTSDFDLAIFDEDWLLKK